MSLQLTDLDQALAYDPNLTYEPEKGATQHLENVRCSVDAVPRRFGCQLTPFQRGVREQLSWGAGGRDARTNRSIEEVIEACVLLDKKFASQTTLPIFDLESDPTTPRPFQWSQDANRAQKLLDIKFIDYQLAQLRTVDCGDHEDQRHGLVTSLTALRTVYARSVCATQTVKIVQTHEGGWNSSRKRPASDAEEEVRKKARQ